MTKYSRKYASVVALAWIACSRVGVDAVGKDCPCPDSLTCDPLCNVCVDKESTPGAHCGKGSGGTSGSGGSSGNPGGGGTSAGAGGGGGAATGGSGGSNADACTPLVTFKNFHAEWSAAENILWKWEPDITDAAEGKSKFAAYEIVVTPDGDNPITFDQKTNPELGVFAQSNSFADITTMSLTTGLGPEAHHGVLRAIDNQGCTFESPSVLAPAMTKPVGGALEIYGEKPPAGYPQDAVEVKNGVGCQAGLLCLRSTDCVPPDGGTDCFRNVRWSPVVPTSSVGAGAFIDAYLEFYVKSDSVTPLWWSESWLSVGTTLFRFNRYTLPADGKYHKIQIPLTALQTKTGTPLDYAQWGGQNITEVNLGSRASVGKHIWLDEVFIRW
ncbi:MAG: hypothetical protein U0263_08095 [Polyangiaceae bacterium]